MRAGARLGCRRVLTCGSGAWYVESRGPLRSELVLDEVAGRPSPDVAPRCSSLPMATAKFPSPVELAKCCAFCGASGRGLKRVERQVSRVPPWLLGLLYRLSHARRRSRARTSIFAEASVSLRARSRRGARHRTLRRDPERRRRADWREVLRHAPGPMHGEPRAQCHGPVRALRQRARTKATPSVRPLCTRVRRRCARRSTRGRRPHPNRDERRTATRLPKPRARRWKGGSNSPLPSVSDGRATKRASRKRRWASLPA